MVEDILVNGARELGVELGPEELEKFGAYTELLIEWNERFNLTSIIDPAEIAVKHHLDSLTCLKAVRIRPGDAVADIGTGAGFPGIPLAIVRPDAKITLIEATKKKLTFLDSVRRVLELTNVELVHARAEEVGTDPEHREHYNVVTARAVAEMRVLVEYCLPLTQVGGFFVAMKGPGVDTELATARPGIGTLGGDHPEIVNLTLPGTEIKRSLVAIKKIKHTPEQFPRHGAKIANKPL